MSGLRKRFWPPSSRFRKPRFKICFLTYRLRRSKRSYPKWSKKTKSRNWVHLKTLVILKNKSKLWFSPRFEYGNECFTIRKGAEIQNRVSVFFFVLERMTLFPFDCFQWTRLMRKMVL